MNLRRQRPKDSLDMLLDTMCNTFGGIILLAVLVTLLISRERHGSVASASDTLEMLQRRLALAVENLQQSLQLQTNLQTKANDPRWKTQVSLLGSRQQLQHEITQLRDLAAQAAKELDVSASADPVERLRQLNAQLVAAQLRELEAQNSLVASQSNTNRLTIRLANLTKQAADLVNESQRQLRLPKEHETGKSVLYVIAQYGRIYTCRDSDLSRNETDIAWTTDIPTETARPIPGRGKDPVSDAPILRNYFQKLHTKSVYVAFCVFDDSFPAFIRAKQIALESGMSCGWAPRRTSEGPVVFGPVGNLPSPQ